MVVHGDYLNTKLNLAMLSRSILQEFGSEQFQTKKIQGMKAQEFEICASFNWSIPSSIDFHDHRLLQKYLDELLLRAFSRYVQAHFYEKRGSATALTAKFTLTVSSLDGWGKLEIVVSDGEEEIDDET